MSGGQLREVAGYVGRFGERDVFGRGAGVEGPLFVGIVGARKASTQSIFVTEAVTSMLVEQGCVVFSGGALGIDHAAESTALKRQGKVCSVLPGSLDEPYPKRFGEHFRQVARRGLLLSLHRNQVLPKPFRFIQRNELLADLVDLLLVVQGGPASGSLTTAHFTLKKDKPVYVWRGPPGDRRHAGSKELSESFGAQEFVRPEDLTELIETLTNQPQSRGLSSSFSVSDPVQAQVVDLLEGRVLTLSMILTELHLGRADALEALEALEEQRLIVLGDEGYLLATRS